MTEVRSAEEMTGDQRVSFENLPYKVSMRLKSKPRSPDPSMKQIPSIVTMPPFAESAVQSMAIVRDPSRPVNSLKGLKHVSKKPTSMMESAKDVSSKMMDL
jgi:hypothetical protein